MKDILPSESTGLMLVVDNPCDGHQQFTYRIDGRLPTFLGFQDLHDPKYDRLAQSSTLANLTKIGNSYTGLPLNPEYCTYTLTVYPSIMMERKYVTSKPMYFSLGAAFIYIFVTALFFVYDCLVRREFNAKQQLLDAKRYFMRFVSHEVRTPLNAVCLGLSVLQDEIEQVVRESGGLTGRGGSDSGSSDTHYHSNHHSHHQPTEEERQGLLNALTANHPQHHNDRNNHLQQGDRLENWLELTREICASAESSVDVLNDLLNYDKIQMGSFSMEFTVFPVWQLIEETSREFRLSARQKDISFTIKNRLCKNHPRGGQDSSFREQQEPDCCGELLNSLKIVGDRIRLTQILRNLVSNALKFTPEQGNCKCLHYSIV